VFILLKRDRFSFNPEFIKIQTQNKEENIYFVKLRGDFLSFKSHNRLGYRAEIKSNCVFLQIKKLIYTYDFVSASFYSHSYCGINHLFDIHFRKFRRFKI